MTLPTPRSAGDDAADREYFLGVMADVWDRARQASRAQMVCAATTFVTRQGGTLIVRGQADKRSLPEAAFVSEGYGFAELGYRRLD